MDFGRRSLTNRVRGNEVAYLGAERAADGTYRIKGTKIFITYGEHDMTDNIVHFVLAAQQPGHYPVIRTLLRRLSVALFGT